ADGVLVIRHVNELSVTTDIARRAEFADRRTSRTVDGEPMSGWFTEPFTLDEVRMIGAAEPLPHIRPSSAEHDGIYAIPTLDDVLTLTGQVNARRDLPVGLYLELKHPSHFASCGLDLTGPLLADLERHDLLDADAPLLIEASEIAVLQDLSTRITTPLTQLIDRAGGPFDSSGSPDAPTYEYLCTREGLAEIATYARFVGASKHRVLPRDTHDRLGTPTPLVARAHVAGLGVHVWTMRDENTYLPQDMRRGPSKQDKGDAAAEYRAFFDAGVDGVFTDFVDTALAARSAWSEGLTRGRDPFTRRG
ncbi:MAG: glycerophosphodiester phosphodiesterase, partial [Actinomycetia bacterium]|nr:glycerophosphodiester phosphodiesterase [Actinomycetes bacterium]